MTRRRVRVCAHRQTTTRERSSERASERASERGVISWSVRRIVVRSSSSRAMATCEGEDDDALTSEASSWDILSAWVGDDDGSRRPVARGGSREDVVDEAFDAFDDEAFWNGVGGRRVGTMEVEAMEEEVEARRRRRRAGDEETRRRRRGGVRRFERALAACEASIEALCGGAVVDASVAMDASLSAPMRRPTTGAATPRRRETAGRGEYRLVVESSVEKLEDGMRWRKYGNKMLSGQRHPRGYYKCTTVPKTVKFHKQVERMSSGVGDAEERYLIVYYGDRDILDALELRLLQSSRGTAKIGSIIPTRR